MGSVVKDETDGYRTEWSMLSKVSLPIIGGSLSDIFIGFVSLVFLGLLGTNSLAAISVGVALYSLLSKLLGSAVVGFQILTARDFGTADREHIRSLLSQMLIIVVLGGAIGALVLIFSQPVLGLLTSDSVVRHDASVYLIYRSPSLILFFVGYVLEATFNSARQTRWGLYASIISNVINLPLLYVLVIGFGPIPPSGLAGIAVANVLATLSGLVFMIWVYVHTRLIPIPKLTWDPDSASQIMRLSSPQILNSFLDYLGALVFVGIVGSIGTIALAANRIVDTMMTNLFTVAQGFGWGIMILAGNSLGKGDIIGARSRLSYGRVLSAMPLAALGAAIGVARNVIPGIFTASNDVILLSSETLIIAAASAPLMAWVNSHTGVLFALGRTKWVMYSNLVCIWFVQIPTALLMAKFLGLFGAYIGYLNYFISRSLLSQYLAKRAMFRADSSSIGDPEARVSE